MNFPECVDNVLDAPIPEYYFLEVSSHCNLQCPYCPTGCGDIAMQDRGNLTTQNFDAIFEKIRPYAKVIDLFNWGEPFMNKGIHYFLERISSAGINSQISSNLSVRLFDGVELEAIVRSGLRSLLASIDGVTQEAYAAYRVNGDVSKALANLENIQKTKRRLGSQTPHLTWAFYLNKYNEHEIELAREKAKEIGVSIWFKELSCPPGFQTSKLKDGPTLFGIPPTEDVLWLPREAPGLGVFSLDARLPKDCGVCRMPFELLNINFNGDVFPCTTVTGKDFVVGNLLTDSLENVWHKRMRVNREQLLNVAEKREGSQCYACKHFPK